MPRKTSYLKWFTAVYALYALIWMSLEGSLVRVVIMGAGTTAVALAYLIQRSLKNRNWTLAQWMGKTAVWGLLFGLGSSVLTLLFMAVKTGLHAHGPEFTPQQIAWVWQHTPLWAAAGVLAGLGIGLLTAEQATRNNPPKE
ncbi:MAG: hypothetical protein KC441_01290 [Anaerolineales bacterium]|nr:hypothetical protein [Anaerolineales bacterium]